MLCSMLIDRRVIEDWTGELDENLHDNNLKQQTRFKAKDLVPSLFACFERITDKWTDSILKPKLKAPLLVKK